MFLIFILPLLDSISQTCSKSTFFCWIAAHFYFYFFVGLWSQSADKLTIHSIPCIAGFYKPTIPQSLPSHLRDYSTCNNARLGFCSTLLKKCQESKLESILYNLTFLIIVYSILNFKSNTFLKLIQFFGKI
jgi:hypothetical protein